MSAASQPALPTEVLQRIFAYCSRDDQVAISEVCHQWDDAVQYLLLQQTYLNVACEKDDDSESESDSDESEDYDDGYWFNSFGRAFGEMGEIKLIDEYILLKSNRKYTDLRVELPPGGMTPLFHGKINELLNICEQRFPVETLYLKGASCMTLVSFFNHRSKWLQNLSFLWVVVAPSQSRTEAAAADNVVVSLPNLEKLVWTGGYTGFQLDDDSPRGGKRHHWHVVTLNAPKLAAMSVALYDDKANRQPQTRPQNPEVCLLFLPTLKLNTWANLKHLELDGISNLHQSRIDNCERMLKNLDKIKFYSCDSYVTKRICDKCPNLKDLIIIESRERPMRFQVSSALSANLERLTIRSSRRVSGKGYFHKLQYFEMSSVPFEDYKDIVSLLAPELTTVDLECHDFCELVVLLDRQLRNTTRNAPSKITDIKVEILEEYSADSEELRSFFERVPQLRRLTLKFIRVSPRDLSFVECLPNLEYLFLRRFTIQLADCKKLAGLKSLTLSDCTIISNPGDEPVPLTALEYFRVECVSVKGNVFPLQVSERQPPIEIIGVQESNGDTVFSTVNFEIDFDD